MPALLGGIFRNTGNLPNLGNPLGRLSGFGGGFFP